MILRNFAEKMTDKINWEYLSENPNAESILQNNLIRFMATIV